MAANDYRVYLRNPGDMENGQARFHSGQSAEPTCRPLVFGTLVVMGLLQIASSVAILLHLTGYLNEVDFSLYQQKPLEEAETGPVLADALRDSRKRERCPKNRRDGIPAAHLPIKAPIDYVPKGEVRAMMIQWNEAQAHLEKIRYHDGRILVQEEGLYYVYAKTCFRLYDVEPGSLSDYLKDGNAQLFQYVYHEKYTQPTTTPKVLMKSGSTKRWKSEDYNMYCEQQGRLFRLKEGDGLYVSVSHLWMLDPEAEGSYFGAFKISN
ncbi:tumor necrosis factor ligand superfamily member 11 [Megalops cyprinoides]|uniref:tumor necrosis factor ligand superfamily member 11 n=1 Tax=Megalops cyprinoides TaxID=118141 RepID=UPI001864352D|nr:tumor necrosis factor ligand superfamily member 11 [Megalops cyprinoides]